MALKDSVSLRAIAVMVSEQVTVAERTRDSEYVLLLVGPTDVEILEDNVIDKVRVAVSSSESVNVTPLVDEEEADVVTDCPSVRLAVADEEQDKLLEGDADGPEGDGDDDEVKEDSVVGDSDDE